MKLLVCDKTDPDAVAAIRDAGIRVDEGEDLLVDRFIRLLGSRLQDVHGPAVERGVGKARGLGPGLQPLEALEILVGEVGAKQAVPRGARRHPLGLSELRRVEEDVVVSRLLDHEQGAAAQVPGLVEPRHHAP